jgi:hypothetical protein
MQVACASQIAASNSTNAVSFSSLVQRTAVRRRDVRRQSRSFARWNQPLRRSPNSIRAFAHIVRDYFPVTHAMDCASLFARQTTAKRRGKSEFPFGDDASDFSSLTRIRIKRFDSMPKRKKRGRPRIRTAAYWREYYRQKQREWRAVHLYGCSPDIVARLLERLNRIARPNGQLRRAENRYRREKTSRHAVKRDGSLRN